MKTHMKNNLSAERVREVLHYDPLTGIFRWRVSPCNRALVGDFAGWSNGDGYLCITIDYRKYRVHRLAWLWTHGAWPDDQLDHINGDREDNRLLNLREVNNAQNSQNLRQARSNSKSGMLGVTWHKRCKKWLSTIRINGKQCHLGLYETPILAHQAYLVAKREHHPTCTI